MKELVETIRNLCKEQGTSITKLEKRLDFANGSIGKWANSQKGPTYDRLFKIAEALGVTMEELTSEEKEKPASISESGLEPERIELIELFRTMDIERVKAALIMFDNDRRKRNDK